MLVCALLCAHCARDLGCSVHPVFPAPSFFGGTTICKISGASRRENADAYLDAVIARSEATRQSILPLRGEMDCFVASLLAMTTSDVLGMTTLHVPHHLPLPS